MTNGVRLIQPTVDFKAAYLDFHDEWVKSGETMIPWVIEKDPTDFAAMVQSLLEAALGIGLPDGWVPDSTYWLVKDDNLIGAVNIRHALTEKLRNEGGHIGYGIRPSERRKGYATRLLALALEEAKRLGINEVLVVCNETNTASRKTIVNNGGKQAANYTDKAGNVINRFWINM
ncbi:acetyltransferase [Lentibacillus populi]|uniref:Acetyltransferase n=1 Tax=Lentibacillus populi TaxID=1827502 RepID=A0A9W5X5E1_9BACI|nr:MULTISPECIES: GNAT family N-acetyltransferase [Bacillaceae]GGB38488.1 acetyltransferase [Lentibacillus populi]